MQQELEQRKDELDQQAVGAAESEGDDSSRFDVKVDKSGAGFNQVRDAGAQGSVNV